MKVMYIAGWGRSGTTIVDNILNAYGKVFSTGELFYLWRRGLVQRRKCGCGSPLGRCAVWCEVLRAAFGDSPPDPRQFAALQRELIRVRRTPSLTDAKETAAVAEYRDTFARLYHAIGAVTGADLIVDSSKVPAGAALLSRMPGIEPYLLHMIRDPRAVAHSWMRATPQPDRTKPALMNAHRPADSTMHWLAWNGLTERIARDYPGRYRRQRYEDFVSQPRAAIEGMLTFAGVPAGQGPFLDDTTALLSPNHTVSGNPSRFRTGKIALRPDNRWRDDQPVARRLAVTAMAMPMLHRYGYHVRP